MENERTGEKHDGCNGNCGSFKEIEMDICLKNYWKNIGEIQ